MTTELKQRREALASTALAALLVAPLGARPNVSWYDPSRPVLSFVLRAYAYADTRNRAVPADCPAHNATYTDCKRTHYIRLLELPSREACMKRLNEMKRGRNLPLFCIPTTQEKARK